MNVTSTPLRAHLRITNILDEVIQRYQRIEPGINRESAELFIESVSLIRGLPVGNGFLTVTTQLAEAQA
ncbi:MAG: hypothetical protein FWB88_11660 [Defluviitaleaceae bacterium]|nr:hypothetical protein [Defluviitaleaceae bacterium]MCL2239750.1 hypothetical protein [Defluviitaleaceae bacterium]